MKRGSGSRKIEEVLELARACIRTGRYLDTRHSLARKRERGVSRLEIAQVLICGKHEKRRDRFDSLHNSWSYSIRGVTVDWRELRVVIGFEDGYLVVITVIDLS